MAPRISSFRIAGAIWLCGIFLGGGLILATSKASGPPVSATVDSTPELIETDGTLDLTFNAGKFTNGLVSAAILQPDGKLVIGGSFSEVQGARRLHIARLNVDGTLDLSFDSGEATALLEVEGMARQADGKIVFWARGPLTRLNSDGSIDNSFGPSHSISVDGIDDGSGNAVFPGNVWSVLIQPDGKIVVAGGFYYVIIAPGTSVARSCVARFNSDGSFDPTFDPGSGAFAFKGTPFVAHAVRQSLGANSGKIIIQGPFEVFDGHNVDGFVRLNTDGSFDDTFSPGYVLSYISGLFVQSGDEIVVFGNTNSGIGIVRLKSSGVLDTGFSAEVFGGGISGVAQQPDGKLVVVGSFHSLGGEPANNVVRLETNGTRDMTFAPGAAGPLAAEVRSVLVRPGDNKIFVGGYFSTYGDAPRGNFAWVNSDGSVDNVFNGLAGASGYFSAIYAIAVQADGKLLVGGFFSSFNGSPHYNLVRLNPDATIDSSFDATVGTDGTVRAFLIQSDGKIVVAGSFRTVNGIPCGRIARLNSDGTLDLSFAAGTGADSTIYALAQDLAGNIYAGGGFRNFDSSSRTYILKLDATGALDQTFNAGAAFLSTVSAIAPPDGAGRIVIGGGRILRLNGTTGARDIGFFNQALGVSGVVRTIEFAPDGKYYIGGSFYDFNGTSPSDVVRLNNDGSRDASFAGPETGGEVDALTLQNGKVFAGGYFFADSFDPLFRLRGDGALDPSFATGTNFGITPPGSLAASSATISALAILPDGKLLVGGTFTQYNGTNRICLARLTGPSTPTPTPGVLGNISTRGRVETTDNVLIGGFVVYGTQPKKIMIRAIGPSLSVPGALADPTLELRDSTGALIVSNNDWRSSQEAEVIATGIPPNNDLESAIVAILPSHGSAYTAIVRGAGNGTGIGVVEVYDLDRAVDSKLVNISTRGLVGQGPDVLIAGTIALDEASQRVIVRALGPSLSVPGNLANPALELRDANGALLRSNDNWRSDQEAEIIATTIPPGNDLEAALVETLPANGAAYTAIVRGVGETAGVAVVEIYSLN